MPIFWILVFIGLVFVWGLSWPHFKRLGESLGFFKEAYDEMTGNNEDDKNDD